MGCQYTGPIPVLRSAMMRDGDPPDIAHPGYRHGVTWSAQGYCWYYNSVERMWKPLGRMEPGDLRLRVEMG